MRGFSGSRKNRILKKAAAAVLCLLALLFAASCNEAGKSYSEGLLLMQEGRYEDAIRKYQTALSQGMKEPVIYADLAAAYEKAGESFEADKAIEQAVTLGAEDSAALKKAGIFYLMRAQDATALRTFQSSLRSEESDLNEADRETMGYIADIYFRAGVYEEALRIYNLLITQGYFTLEHEILAGKCYLGLRQNQAACQYFEMAEQNPRMTARHYVAVCRALQEAGDPTDAEIYYARGIAFIEEKGGMGKGAFAYACKKEQEAAALIAEESDEETLLIRASELVKSCDYEAAQRIYEELIRTGQDGGNVYNAYMMLKVEEGDYTAARQLLQKVLSAEDWRIRSDGEWNEVILYERMHDYSSALRCLREYASKHYLEGEERRELLFLTAE